MILEATSVEAAKAKFDSYPQVGHGLIEFEFAPLIGMPAVKASFEATNLPRLAWWPDRPDATRANRPAAARFFGDKRSRLSARGPARPAAHDVGRVFLCDPVGSLGYTSP